MAGELVVCLLESPSSLLGGEKLFALLIAALQLLQAVTDGSGALWTSVFVGGASLRRTICVVHANCEICNSDGSVSVDTRAHQSMPINVELKVGGSGSFVPFCECEFSCIPVSLVRQEKTLGIRLDSCQIQTLWCSPLPPRTQAKAQPAFHLIHILPHFTSIICFPTFRRRQRERERGNTIERAMVSTGGLIAIYVVVGTVLLACIVGIIVWWRCYRRTYVMDEDGNVVAVHNNSNRATMGGTAAARGSAKVTNNTVPLQIVASPPEGTYSSPLVVELNTLQHNLDILVRIVAVTTTLGDDEGGSVEERLGLAIDGERAIAGLMLYKDALQFTEPGSYFVLAHTLSPDRLMSEVHQFTFVVTGNNGSGGQHRVVRINGLEPPVIDPSRGEITRRSVVTLKHPLWEVDDYDDDGMMHPGGSSRCGGGDAIRALIAQSDIAMWYSIDGSFPRTRYYAPFHLPLPPHQTQHPITVRAVSTSLSKGVASDVVQAHLTVVTDVYHFFDPSIGAPTVQLQASGSMLYFEDPKPSHLNQTSTFEHNHPSGQGNASHGYAGGVYRMPPPPSSDLDATRAPASTMRYDLAGGRWSIMYCIEFVDAARRQRHSGSAVSRRHEDVAAVASTGGRVPTGLLHWTEYSGPVDVPQDVARIAAFTLCTVVNRTLRSRIVTYDVSRPLHGHHPDDAYGSATSLRQATTTADDGANPSTKKQRQKHASKKHSSHRSKSSRKSGNSDDQVQQWDAKVLRYDATPPLSPSGLLPPSSSLPQSGGGGGASADFPPPPLSTYVEDASLIDTPVMCVTCNDVEVSFDAPPRGGFILYSLNDTDPVTDLGADNPDVLEFRPGSGPLKLLRGEYDYVTLTARVFYVVDGGGEDGHPSSGRSGGRCSYRYGHRFSRHFYLQ